MKVWKVLLGVACVALGSGLLGWALGLKAGGVGVGPGSQVFLAGAAGLVAGAGLVWDGLAGRNGRRRLRVVLEMGAPLVRDGHDDQVKHVCPNAYCCEGASTGKGGAP